MRIVFVSQWFDPEPTFKGLLFAQELQRRGHDVTVLTGFPNYPGGKIYPNYRLRVWQRELLGGVNVVRVPLYPSHNKSALHRIANYGSFAITSCLASFTLRRPDVVYAYHPPGTALLAPLTMKWARQCPFVLDIQDLWPDTLQATGMTLNSRVLGLIGRAMLFIYNQAAHVVVLSPGFAGLLEARGVPNEKISTIPNWSYPSNLLEDDFRRTESELEPSCFNVVFAGNMGIAQGLDTVLETARILASDSMNVCINFVGDGVEEARLRVASRGLANVKFLPRRSPDAMARIYSVADALLVHLKDDPLFTITIPSKTQAYLQAGKPIIMAVRGDAAEMVKQAGAGICVEPGNADALADAIRALAAMAPQDRESMGQRGSQFYADKLNLAAGTTRFEKVFQYASLAGQRGFGLKRLGDIIGSTILLLIGAIPLIIIALLVAFKLGYPVIFRQERPGRYGRPFKILKFRTMSEEKDENGILLPDANRLTTFGRWLRASSLDELPAFINTLRGDMSLVGPRPLLMRYTRYFTEEEKVRLLVRPGVTGWAQVNGRNHTPWTERLGMDVWYVSNWSLKLDLAILLKTAFRVIQRKDIAVDAETIMQNLDDERRGMKNHNDS